MRIKLGTLILKQSSIFKKDYKRSIRRGKKEEKLKEVIDILLSGNSLPEKYRNHPLKGGYTSCMECHIEPDWLLIYRIIDNQLYLERTGSHSDLFR